MGRPRVLIADDHEIFSEGLRCILGSRFRVLDPVFDGRALVKAAAKQRPDLMIVDVTMPLLNGIDAVRQIRKQDSEAKAVMLTMHAEVFYATAAIDAGALGYVLKQAGSAELLRALSAALQGRRFISPQLRAEVERSLAQDGGGKRRTLYVVLTQRQREVLQLVAEGRTAREIGEILSISPRTAEFHRQELRKLLSVDTTAELVQQAIQMRLVTLPPDSR